VRGIARPDIVRAVAYGLVVGAVAAAGVFAYVVTRRPAYQARVGLLATPNATYSGPSTLDFSSVVSLTLPSVAEVARSREVLEAARARVAGLPDIPALQGDVGVELVTGTGVVRITVTSDSGARASGFAAAVGQAVIDEDLLAPVGRLRVIDTGAPVAYQTAPDRALGTGFATVAGLVTGILTFAVALVFAPRIGSVGQVRRVLDSSDVAVVDLRRGSDRQMLDRIVGHAGRVSAVPAGRAAYEASAALQGSLDADALRSDGSDDGAVVVVVRPGQTRPGDLRNVMALMSAVGAPVLAVTLA
jgi:capsular polysaccharide biosynthesis protein